MILLMEQASVAALAPHLDPGEISVGFEVNVRHLAPSSIGARVVARADLTAVDRNRLTFTVQAYDGETKIGEGSHRRAVITPRAESSPRQNRQGRRRPALPASSLGTGPW